MVEEKDVLRGRLMLSGAARNIDIKVDNIKVDC